MDVVKLERAVTTLEDHERRLEAIENVAPAVIAAEVRGLRSELRDQKKELQATKKAFYVLALSVTGGSLTLAFTAFQIWGSAG